MNDTAENEYTKSISSSIVSPVLFSSSFPSSLSSSSSPSAAAASENMVNIVSVPAQKQILRSHILSLVRQISPPSRLSQSLTVTETIVRLPEWQRSKCVGIYLSMENEFQTNYLIHYAFQQQKKILVPKIVGKSFHDMILYEAINEQDIANFPKNRWGIPEPSDTYDTGSVTSIPSLDMTKREDKEGTDKELFSKFSSTSGPQAMPFPSSTIMVPSSHSLVLRSTAENIEPPLDLLIVPGVAFDSLCWRMGYGKGYYDNFIKSFRKKFSPSASLPSVRNSLVCIGVGLQEQIVEQIPHDTYDEQLDMVVTADRVYRHVGNGTKSNV